MNHFESPTQYDNAYLGIDNNRSVCSLFSLLVASEFMKDGDLSQAKHVSNLDISVANYLQYGIHGHLSFYEVLELYTKNYFEKDVQATSRELIVTNVIGYDALVPADSTSNYAVIMLKSSKFFTVLYTAKTGVYSIRDCHNLVQFDFPNREHLIEHLKGMYEFETEIRVTDPDGSSFVVGDFNNMEFVLINKLIECRLDLSLTPPKKKGGLVTDEDAILKQVMAESAASEFIDPDLEFALKMQSEEWL